MSASAKTDRRRKANVCNVNCGFFTTAEQAAQLRALAQLRGEGVSETLRALVADATQRAAGIIAYRTRDVGVEEHAA